MAGEQNVQWIANFLWGIADDVLRDLYVRGAAGLEEGVQEET